MMTERPILALRAARTDTEMPPEKAQYELQLTFARGLEIRRRLRTGIGIAFLLQPARDHREQSRVMHCTDKALFDFIDFESGLGAGVDGIERALVLVPIESGFDGLRQLVDDIAAIDISGEDLFGPLSLSFSADPSTPKVETHCAQILFEPRKINDLEAIWGSDNWTNVNVVFE